MGCRHVSIFYSFSTCSFVVFAVLYLYASPAAKPGNSQINDTEWGEFLHLPGEKFFDFAKIRAEIIRDTEAKTGRNAGMAWSVFPLQLILIMFSAQVSLLYQSTSVSSHQMVACPLQCMRLGSDRLAIFSIDFDACRFTRSNQSAGHLSFLRSLI